MPVSVEQSSLFMTDPCFKQALNTGNTCVLKAYLPVSLLPDLVLPLWTGQSLTGLHPYQESCDHSEMLPDMQQQQDSLVGYKASICQGQKEAGF